MQFVDHEVVSVPGSSQFYNLTGSKIDRTAGAQITLAEITAKGGDVYFKYVVESGEVPDTNKAQLLPNEGTLTVKGYEDLKAIKFFANSAASLYVEYGQ